MRHLEFYSRPEEVIEGETGREGGRAREEEVEGREEGGERSITPRPQLDRRLEEGQHAKRDLEDRGRPLFPSDEHRGHVGVGGGRVEGQLHRPQPLEDHPRDLHRPADQDINQKVYLDYKLQDCKGKHFQITVVVGTIFLINKCFLFL